MNGQLQLTAGITMLTHFVDEIIVFAPFVLPRNNWSFDSGKTNGVMPADVMRHATRVHYLVNQKGVNVACKFLDDDR